MTSDHETAPGDKSGPRALMLAILEDAVRCIEAGGWHSHVRARRLAAEAETWVRCEHRNWPFSFVNICEVLGFDVDAMRVHLLTRRRDAARWRRTRLRSPIQSRAVPTAYAPAHRGSSQQSSSRMLPDASAALVSAAPVQIDGVAVGAECVAAERGRTQRKTTYAPGRA